MDKLKYLIVGVAVMLFFVPVWAQKDLKFYTITEKDGLNSNQIANLAEDGNGFIWLGTTSGLSRYDGYAFKFYTYNPNDSLNLNGCTISDLKTDNFGNLWIATERGVSSYDVKKERFTFHPIANSVEKSIYQSEKIFISQNGDIWFYCSGGSLHKLDSHTGFFSPISNSEFFAEKKIRYCFVDGDDKFWAISEQNSTIYRIDTMCNVLSKIDKFPENTSPCLSVYTFLDYGNGIYLMGGDNGLYSIDLASKSIKLLTEYGGVALPKKIMRLYKTKDGKIWIGTNSQDLHVVDLLTQTHTIIESDNTSNSKRRLNCNTVNCMLEDSHGLMWFGTWMGASFAELNPTKQFESLNYPEDRDILTQNMITSFAQLKNGDLVIGSDGGGFIVWNKKDNHRIAVYNPESKGCKMPNFSVFSIYVDKDDNIWSGGYSNPLFRLGAKGNTDSESYCFDVKNPDCLSSNFLKHIFKDSKNRMWVLTNGGGLHLFNPNTKKFKRIVKDTNGVILNCTYGTSMNEASDGTLIIGCYHGLTTYNPDKNIAKNYSYNPSNDNGLSHNWVFDICVDTKKRVWLATASGLNLFDLHTNTFKKFGIGHGFENLVCNSIVEDNYGYLWISTGKGIVKFSPDYGRVIRTYQTSDGILSDNFIPNSVFKDRDGVLYFGSNEGIVYFHPNNIRETKNVPTPTLTGLLINYIPTTPNDKNSPLKQSISTVDELELNYTQSTFSLQFASLGYVNSLGYTYSYKLDGYDSDWIFIDRRREIDFTNLAPGRYVFMLKASNTDGAKSGIRKLVISITPPWYKSWWARTMLIILLVGTIYVVYKYRIKMLDNQRKKLEDEVKTRTNELTELNKKLEQQSEEIQAQRDELAVSNKELTETSNSITTQLANLKILSDLGKRISASLDVNNICRTIHENKVVNIKEEGICLATCYERYDLIEFSEYLENDTKIQLKDEKLSDVQDTLTDICITTRREVFATTTSGIPKPESLAQYVAAYRMPLFNGTAVEGVLMLNTHREFDKQELANIRMIASYAAIAIEKSAAYSLVKSKNNAINGSILYAKTIQDALLNKKEILQKYFNTAIIYRPRDIVSGDFYWTTEENIDNKKMIFVAAVDCTGHGVPGAFMSIIANTALNEIVSVKKILEPAAILQELSQEVARLLRQETTNNKDGMDMSLCRFDFSDQGQITKLIFAGAKNQLYYYHEGTSAIEILKANRKSIAGGSHRNDIEFSQKELSVKLGDRFFMLSDGLTDQNDIHRNRYSRKRFILQLEQTYSMPIEQQMSHIEQDLDTFASGVDQRDDISVVGLEIIDLSQRNVL